MANFYRIQIGNIHLTSTGAAGGVPCKLEVPNVEDLLTSVAGVAIPTANGAVIFQTMPWTKGKQFDVRVEVMEKAEWDDLKDLLNDSLANNTSFAVAGAGDIGNFSVTSRAFPQKPFSAGGFGHERITDAVLRFITV